MPSGFNPGALLHLTPNSTSHGGWSISLPLAGSMFNTFLSTQRKTHSILGQKMGKGPTGEEGGMQMNKFKGYFLKTPKCLVLLNWVQKNKNIKEGTMWGDELRCPIPRNPGP